MHKLQIALHQYVFNQEDADANYQVALEYEALGQTAAAISFFLRASERTSDDLLAYECLLKVALMFRDQGNRDYTVQGILKNAIAFQPTRPEAYYLLARELEYKKDFLTSYMYACQGLAAAATTKTKLRSDVHYKGEHLLIFQRAVAAWWAGRPQESRKLFQDLSEYYIDHLDATHYAAVERNLLNLGTGPEEIAFKQYHKSQYKNLRYRFPGSENIERSYGQVMQDMFVLSVTNGKRNGTYLEIGSASAFRGNNTALLEKDFGWTGVGIEFQEKFIPEYTANRSNPVLCQDALTVDYVKLLSSIARDGVVDYLQLDCEPSKITYDIMQLIPFDQFKFAVITYEHDHYVDMRKQYRQLSREYLTNKGYELVVGNVSPDGMSAFEDWWVHPDLVSREIIEIMRDSASRAVAIDKHMIPGEHMSTPALGAFDWGSLPQDDIDTIVREIDYERVYEYWHTVEMADVVVDIGASTGAFTCQAMRHTPAKIYCVEPSADLMSALMRNVNRTAHPETKIIPVEYAISRAGSDVNVFGNTPQFATLTFKEMIDKYQIQHIDFLKIDCEGGEYDIFVEENLDYLKNCVDFMAVEVHTYYAGNRDRFKWMRDNILPHFSNVKLISCTTQPLEPGKMIDLSNLLKDDTFVDTYPCQFMMYIWNRKPVADDADDENQASTVIVDDTEPTVIAQPAVITMPSAISTRARNRVWVVDDFYEDPDAVRAFALQQDFDVGGIGRGYIGNRTFKQFLFPGLKERFEEIMGRKITRWEEHGMNGRFQTAIAGDPLVYHCDDQKYAGMLYLTPNAPWETGTTLWATKKGGARDYYSPTWNEEFSNKQTFLDRTPYTPVDVIGNVYNRLVIFDASSIHSASEYFGWAPDNCRLWQMFFFD